MRHLLYLLAGLSLSAQAMPEGTVFRDTLPGGQPGPELVVVPAGQFELGDLSSRGNHNERPPLTVQIARSFAIGRFEITFADWRLYQQDTRTPLPDNEGWGLSDVRPVINVSWQEARAYCQWLSRMSGQRYRLPTEAEWEYAARAGTRTRFPAGDDPLVLLKTANTFDRETALRWPRWRDQAGAGSDHHPFTAPVGSFAPNAFGLYDMIGNAWEWCADWYGEDYYAQSPASDPTGPADGNVRVRRGGSWHSWPLYARVAFRNWNTPETRYVLVGFRLLRER